MILISTHKKFAKRIGVLGGMGPRASCYLYGRMISLVQDLYGAIQDEDYPHILIYNLPMVGFDETGFAVPDMVKNQLVTGLQTLECAGADFIFMACNTVHYYHRFLQQQIGVPLLNIIEETVKRVAAENHNKVGLLSSESTHKLQLYQIACWQYGLEVVSVNEKEQKILNYVILQVMAGRQSRHEVALMKPVIEKMQQAGVSAIILGCTELPLVIQQSDVNLSLFNSSEIITRVALEYAL